MSGGKRTGSKARTCGSPRATSGDIRRCPARSDAWHRSILKCLADAVIVTDANRVITFMNAAAERMTGRTLKDASGKSLADVLTIAREDTRTPVKISCSKPIREGDAARLSDHLILTSADGAETHVDNSSAVVRNNQGRIDGLVLVCHDITDRHAMSKLMLSRQKMEAIGAMARGIAHDYNNILGIITEYASSMADSLISQSKAHEDAIKIVEASKHAYHLTDRLLSVARASGTEGKQALKPVSVGEVVSDLAELLEGAFAEHDITLKISDKANMPFVMADAPQLLDVLMNVLLNAADAMPDGGTISLGATAKEIKKPSLRLNPNAKSGSYTVVRISDTGCGISREILQHIFEPFFTAKGPSGVQGLGLTMVQNTVNAWGGWIKVRSAPGKGSTFSLYIPQAKVERPRTGETQVGGETILVIDDQDDDLNTLRTILKEAGYKVHAGKGAKEGLSLCGKHAKKIDVFIVDLIMPGKDGKEVFQEITGRSPEASIIMTSGFSRDYVRGYMGQGGWHFIQKPVEKDQLMSIVRRVLEQRAITAQQAAQSSQKGQTVS